MCQIAMFVLVYSATFHISGLAGATPDNLDASWQVVLEYAFVTGLRFGRDVVFTYGPLGFLGADASQAQLLAFRTVFAFLWTGIVTYSVLGAAKLMPAAVRWFFLAWVVFFTAYSGMEYYLYLVLAYGALQLLFAEKRRILVTAGVLVCFAFLSLVKVTMLLAAVVAVVICALVKIADRQWREAVILPVGFLLLFVTGWCAVGQELPLLVPWLRSSMEIAGGYTAAMSAYEVSPVLWYVFAALVAFAGACCLALTAAIRVPARFGQVTCLLFFAFFEWKHGIVRPDSRHLSWFFVSFPLLGCFLWTAPLQAYTSAGRRQVAVASLVVIIAACLMGLAVQDKESFKATIIGWPATMQAKLFCLGNLLTGRTDLVYVAQKDVASNWAPALPQIRAIAGSERIDVMNCRQWVAIANGLQYSPRPVIQGYSAYTPYLIEQNSQHVSGAEASPYVLLYQETIDDRYPALDDSGALAAVLHNYQPVADEQSYLLLQRRDVAPYRLEQLLKRQLRFGESLDLSVFAAETLFMSVEMKPTAAVMLRRLFFREPRIMMRVQSGGKSLMFRFVPTMGKLPFIVSPLLRTNREVLALYEGKSLDRVSRILFEETDTIFGRFSDIFSVTLYRAPVFQWAIPPQEAERK